MRKLLFSGAAILAFSGAAHAANCSLTDIDLVINGTTYNPTKCATNVLTAPQNPTNDTANMNSGLGTNFTFAAKDDGTTATIQGIRFGVSNTSNVASGQWTVTWADVNGAAPLNLPISLDFDVGIDGGNNGDAYEFTNVVLPNGPFSGTGTFAITFLNNGGNNPAISGLNIAVGDLAQVPPTQTFGVPEPASLAVLGVGLLGIGFIRRRIA